MCTYVENNPRIIEENAVVYVLSPYRAVSLIFVSKFIPYLKVEISMKLKSLNNVSYLKILRFFELCRRICLSDKCSIQFFL